MRSPLVPYRKNSCESGGQVLPRRVEVDVVALGDRLGELVVVVGGAHRPRGDRALADRQRRVGDDELGVDLHLRAQPGAARAGAVGSVEREDPRLELDQAGPVDRAGELLREGEHPAAGAGAAGIRFVDQLDLDQPVGERHRRLDRVRQPLAQVGLHHQPVDDDGDVVLVLLVEHDLLVEPAQLAVDLDPAEALGPQLLELLAVLALAPAHDRRQHHEAGPLAAAPSPGR